ncbi:MAG UNVERIFIED_CONTAM: hypothetical protein LVT10_20890 [Anaerolineae bacterium]
MPLQAMNSYLAWDRRTPCQSILPRNWRTCGGSLETAHGTELPDAVIFDIDHHTRAET